MPFRFLAQPTPNCPWLGPKAACLAGPAGPAFGARQGPGGGDRPRRPPLGYVPVTSGDQGDDLV